MVQYHGDSHEAYLARARYKMEFQLGDFRTDAEEAFRLAPDDPEAILLSARAMQLSGKSTEAAARLEEGIRKHPSDARMYRHLAWIEYFAKRHESARRWLQAGIVACPDAHELHTALAEILIQGKMFDQVQAILSDLKARGIREDLLKYLTARIAVERGDWADAVTQLEQLRTESRTNPEVTTQVHILLAHCFRQLGDTDRQAESLRRVLESDAQSLPARLGLAALYTSIGRLDDAIKEYEQILQLPHAPDPIALELARLKIIRKRRYRGDPTPWSEIEKLIVHAEKRGQPPIDAVLVRAEFLQARRRDGEAKRLLAQHVPESKDPRAWVQYARVAEQVDGTGPDILDQARRTIGDRPEFRIQLASILIARSPLAARGLLDDLARVPPQWTPEQRQSLLQGLAELHLLIHDRATARRYLQELAADRPNDVPTRLLLAETALQDGLLDAIPALLRDIRRVEPPGSASGDLLEIRYALSLAEQGDRSVLERVRPKLDALAQQRPNSPMIHQCLGRWAELESDKSRAVQHYRQAIELGDTDLQIPHRLIRLLLDMKQPAEAEAVLHRLQQHAMLPRDKQRSFLAQVAPLLQSATVQQMALQSTDEASEDPRQWIWLGKIRWDTGDRRAALQSFQTAVAKGRHLVETWTTWIEALVADGQTSEAERLLDRASRELPADLARRVRTVGLELMQNSDQALGEYRAMFASDTVDPVLLRRGIRLFLISGRSREAIDILESLLKKPNSLSRADLAWVRRNLAVLGIADRTEQQFARGFELLRQNEAELGPNVEDLRAQIVLWTQQPNTGSKPKPRQKAIEALEEMIRQGQAGREDRFVLAKLYDTEGNWDKAESHYRAVMVADPNNPLPRAYLIRRLLHRGKLAEVPELLQQLEKLGPNPALLAGLRSRYLFRSGQIAGVLEYLSTYVRSAEKPADEMHRAFVAGSLLDEFVRMGTQLAAEERFRLREASLRHYEKSSRLHPEAVVRMVGLWSRTGQRATALRWLRDPRMKIPIQVRASAEIASLRDAHADDSECRQVEQWLKEAAKQHPDVDLDMHRAELAELRHEFGQAAELYRKVLQRHPDHVAALNNLAWVLAHESPSAEALQLVQRAILLAGPIADLLDTRARAYLALGRAIEAIQDLEDALADAPTAMRYFHLAMAHDRVGNASAAQDALRSALEWGFDERDLHPVDWPDLERLKRRY
jgi:tetratricopeptide (TPR) repeat protein